LRLDKMNIGDKCNIYLQNLLIKVIAHLVIESDTRGKKSSKQFRNGVGFGSNLTILINPMVLDTYMCVKES